VRFRQAVAADVPAIVALVESAYRGEVSRAGWTTEADLLDGQRTDAMDVAALVAGPRTRILLALAEDSGELLGSVLVGDEPDAVYLGMFAVRPAQQARGVGRALLAEAERVGRTVLGHKVARMTVLAQRPELIAWYQRRGYALSGRHHPFPYGNPRLGLPRRQDLVLEELRKPLEEMAEIATAMRSG
jgi:ribosomal protein S18 acetylase RimI-like enzyme